MKFPTATRAIKVVLVVPPPQRADLSWCPNLPITLAYLAAVLEEGGHQVTVIDCPALGIDHKEFKTKIGESKPDAVGITTLTPMIESALMAAHSAKEANPETPIILGGPHATFMDKEILNENPDVDIIVRGEGEQTLLELANTIPKSNTKHLHKIKGITFRKNDQIIRTPNRPLIQNLDDLPRPAYEHLPLKKYQLAGRVNLPILTSRGCPYQCSFCVSAQMSGNKFRMRSIKNVVDEIEWLKDRHGADSFMFYDDAFTFDTERTLKICEEIKKRKIGLPWNCQSRVDNISETSLAKMREANCEVIYLGVESGSQKILDAIGKNTTIEQNEKAIRLAKKAGIFVITSHVIGYPGETEDTLNQTISLIRRMDPDDAYLCVATPYPGTALYRFIKKKGWEISSDWSRYDTTTPVFVNPTISNDKILEIRKKFVDDFYSPRYILRHMIKGGFYNRLIARIALSHIIWRVKSKL